ncbi:MAG: ABC transporter permease [Nitriliruptorales bacterium]|nr:ABC transporter permease [Nitriliruptorales bacterium]
MATDTTAATTEAGAPPAVDPRSRWRQILDLLVSNRLALFAMVVLGLVLLAAVFGPWLAPFGVNEVIVQDRLQAPGLDHIFGTDELGRDVFSRVLLGARASLVVGVVAVGISLTAGTLLGLIAGFYGGKTDDFIMRGMDVLFAFPAILMAIAVLAILGPGLVNAMIAIGIVYTPIFARITRGSVLSVREEVYVRAARSLGARDARLIGLHILPNVAAPIIVQTTISLAFAILSEAALSFLGLGVQPPAASWGRMLAEGRGFIQQAWWMAVFPGLAIFVTVLSFNLIGDALRDVLDPRQRSAIESRGLAG